MRVGEWCPIYDMRLNLLTIAFLVLASSGFGLVGCKKPKGPATVDPHSADGVMLQLKEQGKLLNEALVRKDYRYIHDFGYYFSGLAQAFFSKLDDAQKQRLRGPLGELVNLSSQLDRASGGQRAEATEATVQRLLAVLNDLDKQFQEMKKGS